MVFADRQMFIVEDFYFQADIVEGLETKGVFYDSGICWSAVNGTALYEKTIANVLEVSEYLSLCDALE